MLGITDGAEFVMKEAQREGETQRRGAESTSGLDRGEVPGFEALALGLSNLTDEYPKALVHQILVFDHEEFSLPEGVYPVPPPAKSRPTTVKTVMCDITSRLLGEMAPHAKSLQALSSLESPRISTQPVPSNGVASALPPHMGQLSRASSGVNSRSSSPAGGRSNSTNRISMSAHATSGAESRSSTPDSPPASPTGRSTPPPSTNGNTKIFMTQSPPRESGAEKARSESRDNISTSAFSARGLGERERNKGKGRIGTVIGAMYLLAGRWPDAVKELVQSATVARASSDYLWHAKALDYILVCLLMFAWAGMDFRVSFHHIDETNFSRQDRSL